jgi:hypothetical protein
MIGVTKNSKLSLTFTIEVCVNTNNLVTEVALLSSKVLLKLINVCNRVSPVTIWLPSDRVNHKESDSKREVMVGL